MAMFSRRGLIGAGVGASALAGLPTQAQVAPVERRRLSLNENPWGPSPTVDPAIRAELARVNRYVEDEAGAFERQVAAFEGVPAQQVVLGEVLGPLGLHLAVAGGTASRFVHSAPGYAGFTDPAAAVGGQIDATPLNACTGKDAPMHITLNSSSPSPP